MVELKSNLHMIDGFLAMNDDDYKHLIERIICVFPETEQYIVFDRIAGNYLIKPEYQHDKQVLTFLWDIYVMGYI